MIVAAALVPVKPRLRAKQRLGPALRPWARMALSRAMLRDVLTALEGAALFLHIAVVTRDRRLRRQCRRWGVPCLLPPPGVRGLNRELAWATARPEIMGVERLLVLPSDVPGVTSTDLFRLVLPPIERGVRLVPAPDGGTNALLLVPPGVIPYRFGPASAARHAAAARARGLPCQSLNLPSLNADVDAPADLMFDERPNGRETRVLLGRLDGGVRYRRRRARRYRH